MYHVKKLNGPSRLVRLKVTNQMPAGLISTYLRNLRFSLLHFVFPQILGAQGYQILDYSCGMGLTDGNESYIAMLSMTALESTINTPLNVRKSFTKAFLGRA